MNNILILRQRDQEHFFCRLITKTSLMLLKVNRNESTEQPAVNLYHKAILAAGKQRMMQHHMPFCCT